MSTYYYTGTITVPKEQMDKANEILTQQSTLVQNLQPFRPVKFEPSEDDDGKACFDIGKATEYTGCFYVGDNIAELFDELLDHDIHADVYINQTGDNDEAIRNRGDNLLFLLPEESGVFDASNEELIAELKARGVWDKYVKEAANER